MAILVRSFRSLAVTAAILTLSLAGAGCGGSGGGGGSSSTSAATTSSQGSGPSAGAAIQAHKLAALAALGNTSTSPVPVTTDGRAFDAWNDMLGMSWPELRAFIDTRLDASLRQAVGGLAAGPVRVLAIRNLTIDTARPLGFVGKGAGPGGLQEMALQAPLAPGFWNIAFTADVGTVITQTVFGVPLQVQLSLDVTVQAKDVRVTADMALDASNAARPQLSRVDSPRADLRLELASTNPLLSQVAGTLNSILDPVVRVAVVLGAMEVRKEILNTVQTAPGLTQPWGLGAPRNPPVAGALPLAQVADDIAAMIPAVHLDFDTVVPVRFDNTTYGSGTVVDYEDYGDSPIWTGHYMLAEALHHELTGDARARAGVEQCLRGYKRLLDVSSNGIQGDGLLTRFALPASHPIGQRFVQAGANVGTQNGVPYVTFDDISRDQYQGTLLGCLAAYQHIASTQSEAQAIVERMYDFLRRHDWIVYDGPHTRNWARLTPYSQTPKGVWAWVSGAHYMNPVRYAQDHARFSPVTAMFWFDTWGSSREVHESYYKFNLGHDSFWILFSTETDPARYRDAAKAHQVERDVTGHHENAWFDAIAATCVPAQAAAIAPHVVAELEEWTLRPRRGFYARNSQDPNVAKVFYTSPLLLQTTGGGTWVAEKPLPIAKRSFGDFLWQTSPFELDGGADAHKQNPGIDLLLPYWLGKAYGLIP